MSLLPSLERWCARKWWRLRQLERHIEREARPLARCRLQRDLPPEQVREPPRQRKTEAGPAVPARRRAVELPELVEHQLVRRFRNPDSGVLNGIDRAPAAHLERGAHLALARELVGVSEEGHDDLRDLPAIAAHWREHDRRLVHAE